MIGGKEGERRGRMGRRSEEGKKKGNEREELPFGNSLRLRLALGQKC
jgi:hypothetical protein